QAPRLGTFDVRGRSDVGARCGGRPVGAVSPPARTNGRRSGPVRGRVPCAGRAARRPRAGDRGSRRHDVECVGFSKASQEETMLRQLSQTTRMLALAAAFALPGVTLAQGDNRPVVVVFRFDNNSIGAGRADFDGMATGVQDLLITDLASNSKIRLVDRAHLNEILSEQNLSKAQQLDPATAVRIGN